MRPCRPELTHPPTYHTNTHTHTPSHTHTRTHTRPANEGMVRTTVSPHHTHTHTHAHTHTQINTHTRPANEGMVRTTVSPHRRVQSRRRPASRAAVAAGPFEGRLLPVLGCPPLGTLLLRRTRPTASHTCVCACVCCLCVRV